MTRGEINVDPIEGEFFSTEILGSLPDAVIREAIQNSLDAAIPGQQVKVVITFPPRNQKLPPAKIEPYLKGLQEHLEAKGSGLLDVIRNDEPMDFILIEDFGTRGLEGNIRDDGDLGDAEGKMISSISGATSAGLSRAPQPVDAGGLVRPYSSRHPE